MTSLLDRPVDTVVHETPDLDLLRSADAVVAGSGTPREDTDVSGAVLGMCSLSAALSGTAAAWMLGGIFRGQQARVVAGLGVLLGVGLVYLGLRLRSTLLQYAVIPAALLLGAALVAPAAGAGTSSLPLLVKDAATSSQILQPPIDFAPGWRLILLVIAAVFAASASSFAVALRRPRLAVAVPLPLTIGGALLQPPTSAITTSAVSVGFVMLALATSYAADGSGEDFNAGFELRRIGRSVGTGALLVAALLAASQLSFLFPNPAPDRTVPPQRPPAGKPQPDVPLYSVTSDHEVPLRLGVIDVYDLKAQAWFLPPIDTRRLQRHTLPATLAEADPKDPRTATFTTTITVQQATGHLLPDVPGALRAQGHATIDYDPRTQTMQLAARPVFTGLRYTLTAHEPPTGSQLSAVTGAVPSAVHEFVSAPPPPAPVLALLDKAPQGPYARLQFLRSALYKGFTAAGPGKPVDVSPERVAQLLSGGTGSPYELTASEALLARWAGIPARMGYGYYQGTVKPDGSREFRPTNASTFLETYFAPYGWVPILGTPPQAQASLSNNQKNTDPNIRASNELGIVVYLPTDTSRAVPPYVYVRYYLLRALPIVAGCLLVVITYPAVLKGLRRRRRRRWARDHGNPGRIAIAYCEVRDLMIDLGLPGRHGTPLEVAALVEHDEEHEELAGLVTRTLWGELRDNVSGQHAADAERLAASVRRRIAKAQPETSRLLAVVARASLRLPYSAEVPNAWWTPRLRARLEGLRTGVLTTARWLARRRPLTATPALLVAMSLFLSGCAGPSQRAIAGQAPFPTRLAPSALAGLTVKDEQKGLEAYVAGAKDPTVIDSSGRVLSMSRDGLVQAALEVAQLKPGYSSEKPDVVKAIADSIGKVHALAPQARHQLFVADDGSQRIYLWFPTRTALALLVVRAQIPVGAAELLARQLIGYGDGDAVDNGALSAALSQGAQTGTAPVGSPASTPGPEPTPTRTP
ncbi:MAG: transglutaminase-like domain-containing protein [Actinomycetota bacterium]|nr:transglutaminase-like domain-containing protein [Actinomycetota bacterium]